MCPLRPAHLLIQYKEFVVKLIICREVFTLSLGILCLLHGHVLCERAEVTSAGQAEGDAYQYNGGRD